MIFVSFVYPKNYLLSCIYVMFKYSFNNLIEKQMKQHNVPAID